jgi:hypothetical protein
MLKIHYNEERATVKNVVLATITLTFCFFLSVLVPAIACADWGFRMGDDGYIPGGPDVGFSKIEFFIPDASQNVGITWSGTGVSNFSNTQWSSDKINSTYILATGPRITGSLYWDFLFTGTVPADFSLDYLVYRNIDSSYPAFGISMTIKNGIPHFTSSGWTSLDITNLPAHNRTSAAVPVPPAIFLLGAGLVGVVMLRKKVQK